MPNPFDFLLNNPATESSTWKWATVTSLAPLRVRLDQEPAPLSVTPINLAGLLEVGDRVWVQMHRSRNMEGAQPIVHGTGTWQAPEERRDIPARTMGSNGQSIPNGSWTSVTSYVARPGDPGNVTGGIHFSGGVFTVPVDGVYTVKFNFTYTTEGSYQRALRLQVNGQTERASTIYAPGSVFVGGEFNLEAGDTLQAQLFQNSGGSLTPTGGVTYNWASCALLGRRA